MQQEPDRRIFSNHELDKIIDYTFGQVKQLRTLKGGEYAGDVDALANFRRNSVQNGMTMEQCWGVYVSKHWDAVFQYIRDRAAGKVRVRLEGIEGRVDDIITYMMIFKAMLAEHTEEDREKEPVNTANIFEKSATSYVATIATKRTRKKVLISPVTGKNLYTDC